MMMVAECVRKFKSPKAPFVVVTVYMYIATYNTIFFQVSTSQIRYAGVM